MSVLNPTKDVDELLSELMDFDEREEADTAEEVQHSEEEVAEETAAVDEIPREDLGSVPESIGTKQPRLRRFPYDDVFDFFLVYSVRYAKAHVAGYGKKAATFDRAHAIFTELVSKSQKAHNGIPSAKSLRERYWSIEESRRRLCRANEAASGIAEEETELTQALDENILETDEVNVAEETARNKATKRQAELDSADDNIRAHALTNMRSKEENDDCIDLTVTPVRKKPKISSADDIAEIVLQSTERQRKNDEVQITIAESNLRLRTREFGLKEEQQKRDNERYDKTVALDERKIGLDEKRFEEQKEERKHRHRMEEQQMQMQQKTYDMMMKLINDRTSTTKDN